jgi:hypothetical protein
VGENGHSDDAVNKCRKQREGRGDDLFTYPMFGL